MAEKIEIKGLDELMKAFKNLPDEVGPSVIRNISRKPANRILSAARKLFTISKTGASKRTFGLLKVSDRNQKFIEIGVKGRSLAWIFMQGARGRKKKSGASTGDINPIGNVFQGAADQVNASAAKEIQVDISKAIAKALKRYLK